MALSDRQFQNFVNTLEKQRQVLGVDEYNRIIQSAQQKATQQKEMESRTFVDKAKDFAGGAVYGLSAPGRTIQKGVAKGIEAVTGITPQVATKEGFEESTGTDLDTGSAKVGEFVGQTVPFAVTGGAAGTATAGYGLAARMAAQGTAAATTQALVSGDIGKDEAVAALFGAASVPVGDVISKGLTATSQHLPEWLVRPLVKQTPAAKLKGKDAAKYLVESGRIGSVDSLLQQTDEAMNTLNTQIDDILSLKTAQGVTIQRSDIVDDIVYKINQAGGAIDETEVLAALDDVVPQARGLLDKQTLSIDEANQLRKLLDRTLGDRAFFASQLTFKKDLVMDFANVLRSTVKSSDEALAPLYEEYAKNIVLKQALNSRAVAGGGANSVGLYDLLTGVGAFGYTGDPLTTAMAVGGRRAFESGAVKTGLAQVFKNTDKVAAFLQSASPTIRGAVLSLVSTLSKSKDKEKQE